MPSSLDLGPTNMQALIDSLQGRRRYPVDDPVAGYQPATDAADKPAPYMPMPRPGQSMQQIMDEIARKQKEFHAPAPSVPQQLGDIAAKVPQAAGKLLAAPINAMNRAYNQVQAEMHPDISDSAEPGAPLTSAATSPAVPEAALALMGAGMPRAKPGALGAAGGRLIMPAAERAAGMSDAPFYSATEQAIANAKINKASLDQWHNYLKGQPGVKAEELAQLGITPDNAAAMPGALTKEQMREHALANQVQLKEAGKGAASDQVAVTPNGEQFALSELNDPTVKSTLKKVGYTLQDKTPTKYAQYQLPGGSNYGETLLTLPDQKGQAQDHFNKIAITGTESELDAAIKRIDEAPIPYIDTHWPNDPNTIAWARHNDRQVPGPGGEPVDSLHLEEVQSGVHQAGRKEGYNRPRKPEDFEMRESPKENRVYVKAYGEPGETFFPTKEAAQDWIKKQVGTRPGESSGFKGGRGIPNLPFKESWPDLVLKRMLHKAATEKNPDGSFKYGAMSWTPGEAQAARYDLSKQLDKVQYSPSDTGGRIVGIKNRQIVVNKTNVTPEQLADHIGKDAAEKLLATDPGARPYTGGIESSTPWTSNPNGVHELEGENLKLPPHKGMHDFYDKMLVDKANALGKRYGARVGQTNVQVVKPNELAEKLEDHGYPMDVDIQTILVDNGGRLPRWLSDEELTAIENGEQTDFKGIVGQGIHMIPITPDLRAAAAKGFPLFALGAAAGPALQVAREQRPAVPLGDAAAKALATPPPRL